MNSNLSSFASGLIFGLGLVISQMTNPVQGTGLFGCRRQLGPYAGVCDGRRLVDLRHLATFDSQTP